jgi:orotate phosphoribosyltransferase
MQYRSFNDLNVAIKKWIPELPNNLDLIVGIPRSGLLVANLLALHLNLPLTDVEGLIENRLILPGRRYEKDSLPNLVTNNNILVVDDSIYSGTAMQEARNKIENAGLPHTLYYAAVYVSHNYHKGVDLWYEVVDLPRVFEWNVMHHSVLANSCVDIDGVLCRDPLEKENDDGENYQLFLTHVKPMIVPSRTIGWIVTCRLEKYRHLTENWLKNHNIHYNHLIMMDLPDKKTRIALGNHSIFKAQTFESVNAKLFIESSYSQSIKIVKHVAKPVFCTETGEMLNPNKLTKINYLTNKYIRKLKSNPSKLFVKLARKLKIKL